MQYGWNFSNLPNSPEMAVSWARDQGLLRQTLKCHRHKKPMTLLTTSEALAGRFRCRVDHSRCREYAATKDSFFEEIRLPFDKVIKLLYCFARNHSYERTELELCNMEAPPGRHILISSSTIATWFHYFRELITVHYSALQAELPKLGGVTKHGTRIVIEIEEVKFCTKKYNCGENIDDHWILGMVDTQTNDCRMAVVKSREAGTLVPIIKEYVVAGSEIHTGCFGNYNTLSAEGYVHKIVNPGIKFMHNDGNHSQAEVTWHPVKRWLRGRIRFQDEDFAIKLGEYLWRRYCLHNKIDLMSSLLDAIRRQYVFR